MRALILGTGDAFTRAHFGSSALIEAPEGFVLLDCPDPIHRVLQEATSEHGWQASPPAIDDVILTHLHGDHANGLESFGFARRFALAKGLTRIRPRLHAAEPVLARLWEKLAPAMDGPFGGARSSTLTDYFDPRPLSPDTVASIAGLRVSCRFTRHSVPTIGLMISDGRATLGWSGDTPFEAAHVEWLSGADLIVHETNLGPAHTDIRELNVLPEPIRRRMRLIHMPDDFVASSTSIRALRDRELITVETVSSPTTRTAARA